MTRPGLPEIVRGLPPEARRACLTFDDGPDPEFTPRVLDCLAPAGVKATFFLIGSAAARNPALVRRVLSEGHEVANHTWAHRHPLLAGTRGARDEVTAGSEALAEITGQRPRYFRPPYGHLRRSQIEAATELKETVVLWSLSGKDWGPFGRAPLIAKRLARAQAGDIILLHDARWRYNRPWETLRVLSAFLARAHQDKLELGLMHRISKPPRPRRAVAADFERWKLSCQDSEQ